MRHRLFVPVLPLACGLAACDGVRDSDYQGEILATLEGTLTAPGDPSELPEDIGVAILWEMMTYVPGLRFADFTEVTGEFPSRFRLDLHQPPDEGLLVEFPDGNAIALGRLYLTTPDSLDPILGENGYGYGYSACTPDTVIAYIRDDVAAGSGAAAYLGCGLETPGSPPCSALTAGYHVMNVELGQFWDGKSRCSMDVPPDDPLYCEPDDVRLTEKDLETEIEIAVPDQCNFLYYRNPRTGW